ncbi:MAG: hypothetical protein RLZZ396_2587 [Planctomycetota bacterium]|jgi:hypothetical protein
MPLELALGIDTVLDILGCKVQSSSSVLLAYRDAARRLVVREVLIEPFVLSNALHRLLR